MMFTTLEVTLITLLVAVSIIYWFTRQQNKTYRTWYESIMREYYQRTNVSKPSKPSAIKYKGKTDNEDPLFFYDNSWQVWYYDFDKNARSVFIGRYESMNDMKDGIVAATGCTKFYLAKLSED